MIILRQREFGRTGLNKDQAKQFFKGGNGELNKAAKRSSLISDQANKLKNQGIPQFTSSKFRTIQNPEYNPSELLRSARGNVNKLKYSGSKATNSLEIYGSDKRARLSELSKSNGASLDQAINAKATGRGSIGLYKKQPGNRIYDHGF